jgi:hypothetical protein
VVRHVARSCAGRLVVAAHVERPGIVAATAAREASGSRRNNTRCGEIGNGEGRRGGGPPDWRWKVGESR